MWVWWLWRQKPDWSGWKGRLQGRIGDRDCSQLLLRSFAAKGSRMWGSSHGENEAKRIRFQLEALALCLYTDGNDSVEGEKWKCGTRAAKMIYRVAERCTCAQAQLLAFGRGPPVTGGNGLGGSTACTEVAACGGGGSVLFF